MTASQHHGGESRDVPLTGSHCFANAGKLQTLGGQPIFPGDESLVKRDTFSPSMPFTARFSVPPSICSQLISLRRLDYQKMIQPPF